MTGGAAATRDLLSFLRYAPSNVTAGAGNPDASNAANNVAPPTPCMAV